MKTTCTAGIAMGFVALLALLTVGCGRVKQAAEKTRNTNELKHIALLYQNYLDINHAAPANADDLLKIASSDPQAVQAVQQAKSGKYVILWGATTSEMQKNPQGSSGTILGYEKDVPTAGGLVLMGDGGVKNMTAAEFQSAPKATGK
ncbi:MAG TPA: hypothetical protein VH682_31260 [Gemmataceae bacterium]|jgi:hypothetical protein